MVQKVAANITFCMACHEDQTALMQDIKQMIFQITAADKSCYNLYKKLQVILVELKRQDKIIPENF